ncbi:hypothetical protein RQM47_17360 [Rubrivirga sp. S365]|uniref:hypothetical protein n=1 Tax=Rubrivirga sp. S365 TaxID=3076080 RepID=UPI0028C826A3|nr:hypothetical protein [Rubrivirga sp. S365]MDT7858422.1 hypothetical protein [Rubrivirga sp. S365]
MTDDVRRLVLALEPRGWRWPGTPDPRVATLAELGRLAERSTLPHLLGPLVEGGDVGVAAASAVGSILRTIPVGDLPRVETEVRRQVSWWGVRAGQTWLDLIPHGLDRKAPGGRLQTPYYGMVSFHPSGYVREAAVDALADEGSGRELPYLVLRLNDWVGPVRRAAERAVRDRLVDEYAEAWGQALPLVLGLSDRQRHDAGDLEVQVVALLSADGDALRSVLMARDRTVRRAAVRVALDAGGAAGNAAAELASGDSDVLVRLTIARAVRAGQVADETVEAALLADPAMGVRREVLLGLVERDAPGVDAALQDALLDAHGSIRHDARFFTGRRANETVDFADVYRRALVEAEEAGTGRDLQAALGGVAETVVASDAALALPHLDDWRASVRAAALRTLVRLDPDGHTARIIAATTDPSPRVARTAAGAIADGIPGADADAVFSRMLAGSAAHVRRQALRSLGRLPHWAALPHLLRAAVHSNPDTAAQAADGLARWVASSTRVFTTPTNTELENTRRFLDLAAGVPTLEDVVSRVREIVDRAS